MQFTSKFILLAIALAYGGTAVSAVPVRESSVAARSAEYEDLDAREIEDLELFVRDPFSLFGFGTPSRARASGTPSDDSHTSAGLSTKSETTPGASSLHGTEPVTSKKDKKGRGPRYDPKPTMDVASRRRFRKLAGQNSALLDKAAKDKNHAYHSTAIHMKQEAALRKNSKLLKQASENSNHALHGAALTVKAQNSRRKATFRAALKDERHPLHGAAVAHRNEQHDKTIRNAQSKDPKLVEAALANKNHKLHEAAHRVAAQDNVAGFNALPFGS
jgi:hypothetical protein